MSYQQAFEDREPVTIESIEPDENAGSPPPSSIDFTPRENPDITVDASGRFATHEIIGGITVRQKIGKEPEQISVRGICDEGTARAIDLLSNAKRGVFVSDRITAEVQFASMNTSPVSEGGAVDMKNADMLYEYRLNLVSVESIDSESGSGPPPQPDAGNTIPTDFV